MARGQACVVIVAGTDATALASTIDAVQRRTRPEIPCVVTGAAAPAELDKHPDLWHVGAPSGRDDLVSVGGVADAGTCALNTALDLLAPADVALLLAPCHVAQGWLDHLRDASHADSNLATASALTLTGGPLALAGEDGALGLLDDVAARLVEQTLRLRPRLAGAFGPCVYLRRDALELVGPLDERLAPAHAVAIDLAQRCVLRGLGHVAADDVVVRALTSTPDAPPAWLLDRYPYLRDSDAAPASPVLPRALEAARGPQRRLSVTVDGRSLGATVTGTHVHILQLIRALDATGELRLRVLVSEETSPDTVRELGALASAEVLSVADIDASTPATTIFHRPQQVFQTDDLWFAFRLGERVVFNQLDLIAYRNPGYFADAEAWIDFQRASREALGAADRVIVFSEHTRDELLADELAEPERVRIVPPGVDHVHPSPGHPPDRLAAGDAAEAPFVLCLGTDFRHKNREFALRLFAALLERHAWPGRLAFAGAHVPHGSSRDDERAYLARHESLAERILDLGAITEEEKSWLLGNAAAVLYPTTYEGFGLVPFECAAYGVPCAFAAQSSLAEVLPESAAAIVPWDADASADRLIELIENRAARDRHVRTIRAAAAPVTWSASAAQTLQVYREAVVAPVRVAATVSQDTVRRELERRELIEAHDALVRRLVGERVHAQQMYDDLHAEVGFALELIGPHGSLPEDVQRALLALGQRPGLSRRLYGAAGAGFRASRALTRRRQQ